LKLSDAVYVLRSKNAGVWHVTVDIMFKDSSLFQRALGRLDLQLFEQIYRSKIVNYSVCKEIKTIKVTFLRRHPAGSVEDNDCLGALFYMPLLNIEI